MPDNQRSEINERGRSVLITGGNGLVGRYLTSLLLAEGYKVTHLSRKESSSRAVKVFRWDPSKEYMDPGVFEGIDNIVHLAGANIGERRWTRERKKEILSSRTASARFLHKVVSGEKTDLKAFITASATGYYGTVTSDMIFSEEDPSSEDFLGAVCRAWEEGADLFAGLGVRTVKLRSALVLAKHDSALSSLMKPARFGLVVRLGNGNQYFPWIHIEDLCNIYLKAIRDQNMDGAYNAVAPEHITHNDFVRTMASVMNRRVFLPPVPAWLLRTVLGEMSEIVLEGSRISAGKIIHAGYRFRFEKAEEALKNIILT